LERLERGKKRETQNINVEIKPKEVEGKQDGVRKEYPRGVKGR